MESKFSQYCFQIAKDATKNEIKQAIEYIFNVKVKHVTVMNRKGKTKNFKQIAGRRVDWKKAFVALEDNNKIDLDSIVK